MLFRRFENPCDGTTAYLLADTDEHEAALIDPQVADGELLLAILAEQRLKLRYILRTHTHSASDAACGRLGRYRATRLVMGKHEPASVEGPTPHRAQDNELLVLGFEVIRVIATPGHTRSSLCYLWRDRLFSGDTLQVRAATLHPDSDPAALWDSVTGTLFTLADETLVFPGRDPDGRTVSTIGEERRHNLAFNKTNRERFITDFAAAQSWQTQGGATHQRMTGSMSDRR